MKWLPAWWHTLAVSVFRRLRQKYCLEFKSAWANTSQPGLQSKMHSKTLFQTNQPNGKERKKGVFTRKQKGRRSKRGVTEGELVLLFRSRRDHRDISGSFRATFSLTPQASAS